MLANTELVQSVGGPLVGVLIGALLSFKFTTLLDRQKRRLEKEYEIYADLWDKLFEMRRTISTLDALSSGSPDDLQKIKVAFDAYQAVVRRNEPFIAESVYHPARKIVTLGWNIWGDRRDIARIDERRDDREVGTPADQKLADRQIQLDDSIHKNVNEIEKLFETVKTAMRKRVC